MRKKFFIAAALAALLCLAGCAQTEEQELEKVTVAEVTHSIFYAPMYAAIGNGYFREKGIEPELINSGGADKVMTALLTDGAKYRLCRAGGGYICVRSGQNRLPKGFCAAYTVRRLFPCGQRKR